MNSTNANSADGASSYESLRIKLENLLVLGIIASGMTHRLANHFNTISLNAELSLELTGEALQNNLLQDSLSTIVRVAKTGGEQVHAVNDFFRHDDNAPAHRPTRLYDVFMHAEDLLNLSSKPMTVVYLPDDLDKAVELNINGFLMAVAMACLYYVALSAGNKSLEMEVSRADSSVQLRVQQFSCCWTETNSVESSILSFVRRVIEEHGGSVAVNDGAVLIHLHLAGG